ncbi:MAG: putative integral rane protein [Chthonomonadaceae bacterium]|nr:putative integral rane protein [Chthonomonadaceae bacterium]
MSKTVPDDASISLGSVPIETQEKLLHIVMQRQAALSLKIAVVFLAPLLALPWINQSQPALMNTRVLGFSLTWLILGICFFPLTWLLSAYFVRRSDGIEAECTSIGRQMLPIPVTTDVAAIAAQEEGME